jgi:uncharacterized membrane protein
MERKYLFGIEDGGRTAGMVSYFFVIGWSIGYFGFHQPNKNSLSAFHLRQTLLLYVTYLAFWFGMALVPASAIQSTGFLSVDAIKLVVTGLFLVFWVIGLNAANNSEEKPIPVFGYVAQNVFSFI